MGIDVTVTTPLSREVMRMPADTLPGLGFAAKKAGERKRNCSHYKEYAQAETHTFSPATMEAYGRFGEDTLGLVDNIASSPWVMGTWSEQRGLMPQAARALYRAKVLAELSTRLMQTTVGACIMYRLRSCRTEAAREAHLLSRVGDRLGV